MSAPESSRSRFSSVRPAWLGGLGVLLMATALLSPILRHDFVSWDDGLHVYDNPRMHPVTWKHIGAYWQAPYAQLYIPLTYTVWSALAWLTQTLRPGPLTAELFHSLSVLLHLGSTAIVYHLGIQLNRRPPQVDGGTVTAAGVGAFFFAIHPVQVEAVAWVSGLKDVLCGFAILLAIWQYLNGVQARSARQHGVHYALATAAFSTALLAKPAAVVTPVMAGLLAIMVLQQPWMQTLRLLTPWLILAAGWGIWTKGLQPDIDVVDVVPLTLRPVIAMDAMAFYLGKLIWPFNLGPDYGRMPRLVLAQPWGWLTSLVPIGLGMLLWSRRQKGTRALAAAGVFVAGLLPVLGFIPFLFQGHSTVADRYVYIAMLGPALGVVWMLDHCRQRRVTWVLGGLVMMLLTWRCHAQVGNWQDTAPLFTHALHVNPRSSVSHNNLGLFLARQGRVEEAVGHYRDALRLNPAAAFTHNNLALALTDQGRIEEAIAHYTAALRFNPTYTNAHHNLGLLFIRQGKFEAALTQFAQVLAYEIDNAATYNNIGIALAAKGELGAAADQFMRAVRLQPHDANAHLNLGLVFVRQSRHTEAETAFRMALELRPGWPQATLALTQLLATQAPEEAFHVVP